MRNGKQILRAVVLILLAYVFLFHGIGDYSLKEPDEGRYAEIPREMVQDGDWVVPHLNHVRYFEKPPLFYWAVAISYKIFGVSEWSFRFPNALSAFLCIVVLYLALRRRFSEEAALISSAVLLSSFGFFAMARIVTIDMFFTFWLFCALISFTGFYRERKAWFLSLFYIALGLATLTKGPVCVVLIGITIVIFLFTERNLAFLRELKLLRGLAIYAVITLPWIVAIAVKEKEFLYFFFIDQHVLRFFTSKHKRSGPVYYFFPVLFAGLLPWSVLIPRSIVNAWRNSELRFFAIWTFVVFAFFSLSGSKLPPYILPAFPALSILIGHLFHACWGDLIRKRLEIVVYIVIFAVFALSALLPSNPLFIAYINNVSEEAPTIMKDLRCFSVVVSLSSFVLFCLLIVRRLNRFSILFCLFNLFSLFLVSAIIFNTPVLDRMNTTKEFATIINQRRTGQDIIVNYASYDQTLPFYTGSRVVIASYKGELEMGSRYEDAKDIFINDDQLSALLNSSKSVFTVLKKKRLALLEEKISRPLAILKCMNERCLVHNKQ
ncbi:MAG TPA: glycosyltransferase family 39 protein [Syntrophorhabdaceae bacterium]|nr:glycosyltransferase family 39 protein [Syntrophorhabdaceae bacterium]HQM80462.1 glycosyltransferase family 39 protein [Syntrophorhabdaceae bacterium]